MNEASINRNAFVSAIGARNEVGPHRSPDCTNKVSVVCDFRGAYWQNPLHFRGTSSKWRRATAEDIPSYPSPKNGCSYPNNSPQSHRVRD